MTTLIADPELARQIGARLAAVRERVAAACRAAGRDPAGVTIVGAAKTMPPEVVLAAVQAGLTDLGENYVQDAEPKVRALRDAGVKARWRMIGHLQTNKINKALALFDAIDSVDSLALAQAIARRATQRVEVLLEVNLAGDGAKTGAAPEDVDRLVPAIQALPQLDLAGLMTIGRLGAPPDETRRLFATLRSMTDRHGLAICSMGMTDDFELAIAEGSTMVRIGRAIFGERPAR